MTSCVAIASGKNANDMQHTLITDMAFHKLRGIIKLEAYLLHLNSHCYTTQLKQY